MKSLGSILFLLTVLLAGPGSKAAPSASPSVGPDFPETSQSSASSPQASENSAPQTTGVDDGPEPSRTPQAVSPESAPLGPTDTPKPGLPDTPFPQSSETPQNTSLNASLSEPLAITQINPSNMTYPEPSEPPKPDPTEMPQTESSDTPKTHPAFPEPTQAQHQESPEIPKLNSTETSNTEPPVTPSPGPTKALHLRSPATQNPDTSEAPHSESSQAVHTGPPEAPPSESHGNLSPTKIPPNKVPTAPQQGATEMPTASPPEVTWTPHLEASAPAQDSAALTELSLSPQPQAPTATQPSSLALPTQDSPGTIELTAPLNASPKGPAALPLSARIAGPPAPPASASQPAPATPRGPQRRSRGERVNTIIVVERVEEKGVALAGRPRGAAGGTLCLFLAGTGLLVAIFLLLWCLYRRASRHRPFAHHRLPSDDEPVMHLDAPKDPYDLYFYAPDAWVPSHIATKQPPSTPPLPPKLPPPPRGGRPQRLEPLSPATLPNNFV